MKTIPAVHEEDVVLPIDEDGPARDLYNDFLAASGAAIKLQKKLRREESKVDRLGFPPKKVRKIAEKLNRASTRKIEALAELNTFRVA